MAMVVVAVAMTVMMITVIVPMITIVVMPFVILHLVLQEVPKKSTTNCSQQAMFLLVAEVIARHAASERTSKSTVHTSVSVGVGIGALFAHTTAL
jgi:hypothetical protein